MSDAAARIAEHYAALERGSMDLPPIGTVYWSPITPADYADLERQPIKNEFERTVRLIILKAETEDGAKMFGREDIPTLMAKAPADLIARLATRIQETYAPEAPELGN